MKINHHPSPSLLKLFAAGELKDSLAVMIAAHVESCSKCQKEVKAFENTLAQGFENNTLSKDYTSIKNDLFHKIIQTQKDSLDRADKDLHLSFEDMSFNLPKALAPLKKHMSSWKTKLNTFSYSKIISPQNELFYFLYFKKGVQVPVHTHTGNEFVYVIAGSFNDTLSEYATGDFAQFTHQHSHSPMTEDPDGCLLLVHIESPFYFQKGWSRLFNLLGSWLYR